ncbi:MAG: DUF3604 domain-containing protein [Flavobacteriaceae bacterium]|nr:DUF3604 domain-containing protein [Flavobacteriaceae bacterium]
MKKLILLLFIFTLVSSGSDKKEDPKQEENATNASTETEHAASRTAGYSETKNAYFGNLHIHTSWSFDGFTNGSVTGPDDAYRWAQGEAIPGGGDGTPLQIKTPLDWYAVSDHAEWMGMFKMMADPSTPISKLDFSKRVTSKDQAVAFKAFGDFLYDFSTDGPLSKEPLFSDEKIMKSVWKEIIEITDKHNKPGKFTTFPAFEWSSNPNTQNLHRVVLFKNSDNIPKIAYSSLNSTRPEDLWTWMEESRDNGATLLAIPHNGNASDGLMFSLIDSDGNPISKAYSETRSRNEPIYEISQIKGTSEVHPDLSPNDEFSNFEIWDYTLAATAERNTHRKGSYLRQALLDGIRIESEGNGNPFKYGIIGDSDSHDSAASIEEDNYTGKFGMENEANHRLNGVPGFPEPNNQQLREFSSGGLAGVWAEENTRDAIYNAMLRKETFGTSGTRMKIRFFGSFNYNKAIISKDDWLRKAYDSGVPMGSDLSNAGANTPIFIVQAIKEANGANLDRIQIIKGWVNANGKSQEKIYNIALSDERKEGKTPVGNTVDLKTAKYSNTIGGTQFFTTWTDPNFDATQNAFYYVRVIEIPTPRWSTYDAVTLGIPVRTDIPSTIQERGWSSPIWYSPK